MITIKKIFKAIVEFKSMGMHEQCAYLYNQLSKKQREDFYTYLRTEHYDGAKEAKILAVEDICYFKTIKKIND